MHTGQGDQPQGLTYSLVVMPMPLMRALMCQLITDLDLVGLYAALVDPVSGLINVTMVPLFNSGIRDDQAQARVGGLGQRAGFWLTSARSQLRTATSVTQSLRAICTVNKPWAL